jgi:hypothetical protein
VGDLISPLSRKTVASTGETGRAVEDRSEPPQVGVDSEAVDSSIFQILADTPIDQDEQDLLGFGAYADALAELLDHPATSTPLTVAITGPWGSGKTSLAKMVEARLRRWPRERGDPEHIICWFNAWLHDDAPNLGAAFAAEVARVAARHRPLWRRILRPLPTRMLPAAERWRRRLVILLLCLLLLGLVFALQRRWADDAVGKLAQALGYENVAGIAAVLLLVVLLWNNLASIAQTAGRFINDPAGEAAKGSVNHVRSQLRELVHQATDTRPSRRRLVIFVDDLERCTPPRAVEVCEKAYQLFGHRDVAVVLIADITSLAASAELKHGNEDVPIYGQRYLQKIVQIQFDLPPVRPDVMRSLLRETSVGRQVVRTPPDRTAVRFAMRRVGRRPAAAMHRVTAFLGKHGWSVAGYLFLGDVLMYVALVVASEEYVALWGVSFLVLFVLLIVLISALVVQEIRLAVARFRSRWSRARIDQEIEAHATGDETDSKRLANEVLKSSSASRASGSLVERRVQRYLVDASDSRREAEAELLRNPPDLPRDAKRMINQLRVLLAVALNRGMLANNTGVTAAHLGRWIVLQSRWPEVGRALAADPARLEQVEACATPDDMRSLLSSIGVQVADSDELLGFLQGDPTLCRVLNRLLRYAPTTVN